MSDERISVREAARQRTPLGGVDAEALEGALQQCEREVASLREELAEWKAEAIGTPPDGYRPLYITQRNRTEQAERERDEAQKRCADALADSSANFGRAVKNARERDEARRKEAALRADLRRERGLLMAKVEKAEEHYDRIVTALHIAVPWDEDEAPDPVNLVQDLERERDEARDHVGALVEAIDTALQQIGPAIYETEHPRDSRSHGEQLRVIQTCICEASDTLHSILPAPENPPKSWRERVVEEAAAPLRERIKEAERVAEEMSQTFAEMWSADYYSGRIRNWAARLKGEQA